MYIGKTIEVEVEDIHHVTPIVKIFTLRPINSIKLPIYSAGSHIMTYVNNGNDMINRAYSLIGLSKKENCYKIAIQLSKDSKGGSLYWHEEVKIGHKLSISYPKNFFPLSFKAKHHVFYAAGIGITPFLSMMEELKSKNISFELHYASSSKNLCAFYEYINENFYKESHFYFSKVKDKTRLSDSSLYEHRIGTHVYLCGPTNFISQFTDKALKIGYPKNSIHYEYFKTTNKENAQPFEVKLLNGDTKFVSKDKTLLEVLLQEGIKVPYSCQVGRCGTCELKVLKGIVDHNDSFYNEEQRNSHSTILSCVSRANSKELFLDL